MIDTRSAGSVILPIACNGRTSVRSISRRSMRSFEHMSKKLALSVCLCLADCRGSAGAQSSRCQCRTHVIARRETRLGGRDHRLETGVITQRIQIRIDFGVIQEASRELFKYRSEQFECGVGILSGSISRARLIQSWRVRPLTWSQEHWRRRPWLFRWAESVGSRFIAFS
jgi:hypothetical protein